MRYMLTSTRVGGVVASGGVMEVLVEEAKGGCVDTWGEVQRTTTPINDAQSRGLGAAAAHRVRGTGKRGGTEKHGGGVAHRGVAVVPTRNFSSMTA
jgi:hypothetical protein